MCRLCSSCWTYWKKYGGLKNPDKRGKSTSRVCVGVHTSTKISLAFIPPSSVTHLSPSSTHFSSQHALRPCYNHCCTCRGKAMSHSPLTVRRKILVSINFWFVVVIASCKCDVLVQANTLLIWVDAFSALFQPSYHKTFRLGTFCIRQGIKAQSFTWRTRVQHVVTEWLITISGSE